MQQGNEGQVNGEKAFQGHTGRTPPLVGAELLPSGVAIITIARPDEAVVTLTEERLTSLEAAIAQVADMKPKGVVIAGPHADMFTVGADVHIIRNIASAHEGAELARRGQKIFDAIASLPFPSVAALSGPCVGGGYELALACTYRICSDAKSTLIGLPEIKLGIIPGFGGTQRLPRLIGLPKALEIILNGKTLRARQALKAGLVNEVVPVEKLRTRAEEIASGRIPQPSDLGFSQRLLTFSSIGRRIVRKKAFATVMKQTKGFYPAPLAALDACIHGLEQGIELGLDYEAKQLGKMVVTPESKALVKIFFLTEASKAIGRSAKREIEGLNAVVIGAGTMGSGIAALLAKHDIPVVIEETNDAQLQKGLGAVRESIQKLSYLSDQERTAALARVRGTINKDLDVSQANFVIEAIVEDMSVKKQVLSDIAQRVDAGALIATNTSSLSVAEIAKGIPSPERVVGMHFFNPVDKMPLVEIIRGNDTNVRSIALTAALAVRFGKYPVVVEDVPGFLVNRILTPYLNTAAILLGDGYSLASIERAATDFGMPMGPFRLLDEVGLDIAVHVARVMRDGYGERMVSPPYSETLVQKGRFGKKRGGGFYEFDGDRVTPFPQLRAVLGITSEQRPDDQRLITDALIMSMINEAVRCLDEGVAGQPGPDAAHQVDLASVMGIGFPAFRGGVFHYAETIGTEPVLARMRELEVRYGSRFAPAPGLIARVEHGVGFVTVPEEGPRKGTARR